MGCVCQVPRALRSLYLVMRSIRDIFPSALVAHPKLNRPPDSTSVQNRYLPMVYMVWVFVCMCSK